MSLLKVENASFARGKRVLFEGLNLELERGEILAILGQNGVGKTTFLKCLMNFLPLKTGRALLNGRDIKSFSIKELFSIISYVPQAKNHGFGLSVLDMVILGLNNEIKSTPKKEHILKAEETLKGLNLEHLKDRACDSLSGGELQMVISARALVSGPSLIILDEPESNLDFKNQLLILENLERLKALKKGIIFNTHYPQNAKKLADKILILEKNAHVYGSNKLLNKIQLAKSYEVKPSFFDYLAEFE